MSSNNDRKKTHSADDHTFGAMMGHRHMPWEVYDHDHDTDFELLEAGSKELEHVPLTSIGIDIGSSGTQVVFSKLLMRGPGEPPAMRRIARSRETIYMSPVVLTPYIEGNRIDAQRLRGSIDRAYREAGLTPDDINTGAIIMTGAAARRDNAAAILDVLSAEAGEAVSAAAGDHMEAVLAAFGSGAVDVSAQEMSRILNVDIGGATTKFALIDEGQVIATAAMHIGGRQMSIDAQNRIVRLDREARMHAQACNIDWQVGEPAAAADMRRVAEAMAAHILAALRGKLPEAEAARLYITEPLPDLGRLDGIRFSGGVAEYVYGHEKRDFGDLGRRLGQAIARRIAEGQLPAPLLEAGACIRATALGASEYSVQMSGTTSCITSHAKLLPRTNLPVLKPPFDFSGDISADALAQAIRGQRHLFDDDDPAREVALAFRWRGSPDYGRVRAFAEGIAAGLADRVSAGTNIYILLEGDAALTLGGVLRQDLGIASEILVIDGIVLRDFDFVDIGRIRLPSGMVPVTVKSLLFNTPAS